MSSRVLKAGNTTNGFGRRLVAGYSAGEAGDRAAVPEVDLVLLARERATLIIQEALDGAKIILEEAREQGFREGCEMGLRQGKMEAQSLIDQAHEHLKHVRDEEARLLIEAEKELARLSVQIAARIIKREVRSDPELILGLVRDALLRVRDEGGVTARLNPLDAVVVRSNMPALLNGSGVRQINIEEDGSMEPANCVITTSRGEVDERLASQIRRIETALEGVERDGPG